MRRLPGLDLLRAIAIVSVMLFHSYVVGGLGERLSSISAYGWMGVDLFFVLSGYLIGSQLLQPLSRGVPISFRDFYLRRAFRVLPAFAVVLGLYVLWPRFREAEGMQPVWQFLTFTMNLLIDARHHKAFSHAWSLCVEEHFYLLFPWLAWALTRVPSWRKCVTVCVGVLAFGMLLRGELWVHEIAPVRGLADGGVGVRFLQDIYYPTYSRLDGLLAGVVVASIQAYRPLWWARLQANANLLLVAGLGVLAAAIWVFGNRLAFGATVVGYPLLSLGLALLVASAATAQGSLGNLRIPGAKWIALASYSLYLSHKAVFHLVHDALPADMRAGGLLIFAIYALATFAAGAMLYYGVERPFLRLREGLFRRDISGVAQAGGVSQPATA